MGEDNITDFLAINIASTDYVGHAFGPNSYIEIEDTYLRLDQDLEVFFQQLDKEEKETTCYSCLQITVRRIQKVICKPRNCNRFLW